MSKSQPEGCLFLTDDHDQLKNKIMKAKTDSTYGITYDKINRKNLANLIEILAIKRGAESETISEEFKDCGHQEFKEIVSKEIADHFCKFRDNYKNISEERVREVLKDGTIAASKIASFNLEKFLSCVNK